MAIVSVREAVSPSGTVLPGSTGWVFDFDPVPHLFFIRLPTTAIVSPGTGATGPVNLGVVSHLSHSSSI
jgi:hypothetical protein